MKPFIYLLFAGWLFCHTGAHSQTADRSVLRAEQDIIEAVLRSDTATLGTLLSANYTYTLPDGKIITRARFMADVATWWEPVSIVHQSQSVQHYDGVAVVIGKAIYRWKNKAGVIEAAEEQYTDTYIMRAEKWVRVASHASCLSGRCT